MVPTTLRGLWQAARSVPLLLPLLLALAPAPAHGAPPLPPAPPKPSFQISALQHVAWRKRDGAPAAAVTIAQDARGMLWFGGGEGLYRFDGVRFDRMEAIDGNPLPATDISAVAAFGNALWVAYRFGGASKFENGRVTHYGEAQGLPQRTMQGFARTPDGVMWIVGYVGAYRLDGERWTSLGEKDGLTSATGGYNFAVARNGALLLPVREGLYIKPADSRRFHRVAGVPNIDRADVRDDGSILLKAGDHSLFLLDAATEAVRPLPLPGFNLKRLDVIDERGGALWVASRQGLHLLDPALKLKKTYSMATGFSGRIAYISLRDREGNTWFATENGVDRISEGRINKLDTVSSQSAFMSVLAGDNGDLWVGSMPTTFGYDDVQYRVARDGSQVATPVRAVSASTRARDGSAWFAGSGKLWRVRGDRYQHWDLPAHLRGGDVQSLAVDSQGLLWVSVIGLGIHTFRDGAWGQPADAGLARRTAISLYLDRQGQLWFSYPNNAIAMLAADGVLHQYGPGQGIDIGNVLTVFGGAQRLWLGGDQGFGYWDGRRFQRLHSAQGPELYGVSGIVETAGGDVWLHGAGGVAHLRAQDLAAAGPSSAVPMERFNYLDGYEGVASQLRPMPSLTETTDGRIWYATTAQVGWIDTQRRTHNRLSPTPQITGLQAGQQHYGPTGAVRLPAGSSDLRIDFTAAVLTIPERARFRYRLVGQDAGWRGTDTMRQAFYTNMGPGEYRFEVQAGNEDGTWGQQTAHLDFAIAPTFVQTLWFKLLCALVLALAGYGLFRWRVQLATARVAERMQERLDERTRIARTLHDSFLQSVQALIMRFDRIKRGLAINDPLQREIDNALDTADAVLLEGREQVWALRSGDDAQPGLHRALEEAAAACGQQYGVTVHVEQQGKPVPLPDSVQHEVHAIALEALHNACRHSGAATVHVVLRYAADGVQLHVLDAGCGIDDQVLANGAPHGHWGLAGMRERAHLVKAGLRISRRAGGGTEVRLEVPLTS